MSPPSIWGLLLLAEHIAGYGRPDRGVRLPMGLVWVSSRGPVHKRGGLLIQCSSDFFTTRSGGLSCRVETSRSFP